MKTYTIEGREYTELDINKQCATILGNVGLIEESISHRNKQLKSLGSSSKFVLSDIYNPCRNILDTEGIIDKIWSTLNSKCLTYSPDVTENDSTYKAMKSNLITSRWEYTMKEHNCSKLIAACICFIEINS